MDTAPLFMFFMSEAFVLSLDTGDTPISTTFSKVSIVCFVYVGVMVSRRDVVYGFRFRPSSVNDHII